MSRPRRRDSSNPRCSVDSALLVASRPLQAARISLQLQVVLASLRVLEPEDCTVTLDEHHAGARLDLFVREIAYSALWHLKHLIER